MTSGWAQGIPEPDVVLYGIVRNVTSNANIRLGYGTLQWTFQPASGPALTFSTALTNINNQFSYILRVPCETAVPGFPTSPTKVQLTPAGTSLNRSQVAWNGTQLTFVQPAQTNLLLRTSDRGKIERIDLNVAAPLIYDGNGLPIDWELTYFGHTGVDPLADPDGDGMSTFAEFRAGTDPTDGSSNLRFIEVRAVGNGVRLKWQSSLDRKYALQRAATAGGAYLDIVTNIASTAPVNTYLDSTATNTGPYFYRLRIDDLLSNPTSSEFKLLGIRRDPLGGISIDWQSSAGRIYAVQRASSLSGGFSDIATGIDATPPVNTYRDASATGQGPYFYRLRLISGGFSVPVTLRPTQRSAPAQFQGLPLN